MVTEEFDDIYRRKFNGLSQNPPAEAWENISGKGYKNAFENISSDVPFDIWNNIQQDLANRSSRKKLIYRSAAALVLLLFTVGGLLYTNKKNIEPKIVVAVKSSPSPIKSKKITTESLEIKTSENQKLKKINEILPTESAKKLAENYNRKERVQKNLAEQDEKSSEFIVAQNNVEESTISVEEKNIESAILNNEHQNVIHPLELKSIDKSESKSNNYVVSFSILLVENIEATDIEKTNSLQIDTNFFVIEKIDFEHSILPQGYAVGGLFALNYISTISPSIKEGFDKNSQTINQTNFGIGYGISGEVNLSDKHGLELVALINNQQGHKYSDYHEGKFINHELRLDYSQLSFLYKRKNTRIGMFNKPTSFDLIVGGYVGYLKKATNIDNLVSINVANEYKKFDLGIIMGAAFDIYPSNNWCVSTSLYAGAGALNIFYGNVKIPSNLNATRNILLGSSLGVKYFISKK